MRTTFALFLSLTCWQAATAQSLPALIKSLIPSPGATGVARNTGIAIRFAQGFPLDTSKITLRGPGGSAVLLLELYSSVWTETEFVCRPAMAMAASTLYTVDIAFPALKFQYTFTTGEGTDTTPPKLVSVNPGPGAPADPFGPLWVSLR
jgi:hypothetical protein